jgi:SAM-dependent methyltransferase
MTDHTGASYETIASRYAATVDTKPWNAYYERPAVVSLIPDLAGTKVLDVGCGSGWYTEYLVGRGAVVTSFDFNAEFVSLTRARIGERARVLKANLAEPLAFASDEEFDVALCPLVLHYLRDWQPTLREIHRVLKPHGVLVFSTHHPFMDWTLFKRENYFAIELLEDEWEDVKNQEFEILLWLGNAGQAKSASGVATLFIESDDLQKDFAELKARGLEFVESGPEAYPFGLRVTALDPEGNPIALRQTRK